MLPSRDSPQNQRPTQTQKKELEKNIPSICTDKDNWVAILMADGINFQKWGRERDLRGQYIVLEGAMHQDAINSVEILTHNVGAQNIKRKS